MGTRRRASTRRTTARSKVCRYVPVAAHDHRCLVGAGRVVVLDVVVQQQAVVGAVFKRAMVRCVPARLLVAPPLGVGHGLVAAVGHVVVGPGHGRQDLLQRAAPDVADGLGAARALALHGEAAAPAGRVPILALESRQRKY